MKILEVMTEHTGPFKILIEVLKEMLQEANIEFIMDNPKKNIKEGEEGVEGESDAESDAEEDVDIKTSAEKVPNADSSSKKEKKKDNSGMRITAIDMTQTVLINLKLDAKEFATFKCAQKKVTLGVNLGYLHKMIKSLDKDDSLTLYQEHDNKNLLKIKVENQEGCKDTEFNLKLMELKNEKMEIPNVEFEAVITMNSAEFHKLCREMNQIAELVDIRCMKNKIEFTCKGDIADRKTVYKTDNDDEKGTGKVYIESPNNDNKSFIVQGIYELKHLVMFGKCGTLCNDIEIYLKSDYPLVIKYQVATLGRLLLCLSPVKKDTIRNVDFDDELCLSEE
jgi:proliferating cell nuclear antigen